MNKLQHNKVKRSDHRCIPMNQQILRISAITGQEIEETVLIAKAELGRAKEFLEAGIIQLPGIEEVAKRVEVPKDGPRQNHPNKWRDLLPKCQQETI